MTKREWDKCMQAVWLDWSKRLGRPIPAKLRSDMEDAYFALRYGDGMRMYNHDTLREFCGKLPLIIVMLERSAESSGVPRYSEARETETAGAGRDTRKFFERRLRLVEFVLRDNLPFMLELQLGSFKHHRRINWPAATEAWNRENPNDTLAVKGLKATFYRAIREPRLMHEYIGRRRQALKDLMTPVSEMVDAVAELRNKGFSDEEIARQMNIDPSLLREPSEEEMKMIKGLWTQPEGTSTVAGENERSRNEEGLTALEPRV